MKDTRRPAAPDERGDAGHVAKRPTARDIAMFGAALLGSIGVGSVANYFRKRSAMKQHEQEAGRLAEIARERAARRRAGHEMGDARVGPIVLVVAGMLVAAAAIYLALGGLFAFFAGRAARADASVPPLALTPELPPAPRLQVAPAQDLAQLRATEQAQLSGYGWVDRDAGVVKIPIDRAMELVAQRGLPTSAGQAPQPAGAAPQPTGVPGAGQNVPAATIAPQAQAETPAAGVPAGAALFASLGCSGCHQMDGSGVGPALAGVFGSQVRLEDGTTVTANEAYIRESILNPGARVVAGRQPAMPSFDGRVSDEQLSQLVAYIRSLGR
jgi:mono/diheme cytochrome c family protein